MVQSVVHYAIFSSGSSFEIVYYHSSVLLCSVIIAYGINSNHTEYTISAGNPLST